MWWPVLLVFNATFNNMSVIIYNMVNSFIGDILLKEALNTNKTGHNVIDFNGHIAESGIKHQ
jgi:hypothetical protein